MCASRRISFAVLLETRKMPDRACLLQAPLQEADVCSGKSALCLHRQNGHRSLALKAERSLPRPLVHP